MKSNWILPGVLTVVEIHNPEQMHSLRADIEAVQGDQSFTDFDAMAQDYCHNFTLYYLGTEPVGLIRRDFHKNSVELHGGVRAGFDNQGVAHYAVQDCLERTFRAYPKVFIQIPPDDIELKGFAQRWGFGFAYKTPEGLLDYELTRDKYLSRRGEEMTP